MYRMPSAPLKRQRPLQQNSRHQFVSALSSSLSVVSVALTGPRMFLVGDFKVTLFYFGVGPAGAALLFYLVTLPVRSKMDRLRAGLPDGAQLQADCRMVHGIIECPGIAQVRDGELVLTPLVGKKVAVPLADITIAKETSWFNGSWYPGQTGFWLESAAVGKRLGFAVSHAEPWRTALLQSDRPNDS